ncbi:hypothetical protein N9H45_02515 [Opitutales bacterium]|nr:hypothetical protein [Opitutales bacterium]
MTRCVKRYSRMRTYAGAPLAGMAHLGYRPFGPSPPHSAFPLRHVRHPSVHSFVIARRVSLKPDAAIHSITSREQHTH